MWTSSCNFLLRRRENCKEDSLLAVAAFEFVELESF